MKSKLKILLIFPPSTVYRGDPTMPVNFYPLGLMYIAAYLEKFGYQVSILDTIVEANKTVKLNKQKTLYGLTDEEIFQRIKKFKPDVVGISCIFTAYAGDSHRVASLVKRYNRNTPTILGGSHPSIFPKLTLKDKNIDLIVVGEGEKTFLEIVEHIRKKKSLMNIPGTITRKDKKIITNKEREFIKNIDRFPFPAYHLIPIKKYFNLAKYSYAMRKPGTWMITSRGCPGRCIYCSIHSVWRHTWRGRSPIIVVNEIKFLIKKYGVKEFYFLDDSMGASKERLQAICQEIIKRKLDIRWTVPNGIAHWNLDKKTLDLMKQSGCYRITFGIESGDSGIRRLIGKPYPLDQATSLIKYANKIGMWTICTFIFGFPEETKNQIENTIKYAIACDTDLAIFYLLSPYPGTLVYNMFCQKKLLNLNNIFRLKKIKSASYSQIGRILAGRGTTTKHFNEKELQIILDSAYQRFFKARFISFFNPMRIIRKIRSIEDFFYVIKIGVNSFKIIIRMVTSKFSGALSLRYNIEKIKK